MRNISNITPVSISDFDFESHPESHEALFICKVLQLRRELILLAK